MHFRNTTLVPLSKREGLEEKIESGEMVFLTVVQASNAKGR